MKPIDLHVHSTRSDGTCTPEELVDIAIEKGLAAFALTDHDTVDGLQEAMSYAQRLRCQREAGYSAQPDCASLYPESHVSGGSIHPKPPLPQGADPACQPIPEVIPGIEFSTEYQGRDIHIVGLYIDYRQPVFCQALRDFVDSRDMRNRKMCRLLQEAGISITYEGLLAQFPDAVITRAHYAKYLLSHGYVGSHREAFDRYVGDHAPCFVPREKVTPAQAVHLILQAGGVPVLAHPILYRLSDRRLEELTAHLAGEGLMAIEAIYSTYNAAEERQIRLLAEKYHLLLSGGSDFHGANKPGLDMGCGYGKLFVPYSILEEIKAARKQETILP